MAQGKIPVSSVPYWSQKWFEWFVFGGFAVIYLLNRSPFVGFNDGLTFLDSAANGFDLATNATSHFLYNNLQHVLLKVFFFLPHVVVLTLFSIACALGTLFLVYRIGQLLAAGRGFALLPVVVLGISFTFWQQSEIIEVYAFNNLLFSGFAFTALKDILSNQRRNYLLLSLLLGVGLLTHIQHILSIPFFLFYLWGRNDLRIAQKLLGMLPWLALMSILFILPAFTQQHSLRAVFFESKFQDELLGVDFLVMTKGLIMGMAMLLYNFQLFLVPIVVGWRQLWRVNRRLMIWLLVLAFPYLAFAVKYSVNDNHVFYLCFHIVLVLPLVFFAANQAMKRPRMLGWLFPAAGVFPIVMYAAATILAPNIGGLARYNTQKAYKGGVVHMFWPGKAWAKDPLSIAWREAHLCQHDPDNRIDEWNFQAAVRYLKRNCPESSAADGWTVYPPLSALVDSCFFECPELLKLMQKIPDR